MTVLSLFVVLTHVLFVFGDVYMHNPRGSNDRNCERNVNRNNGNRLFNSQNNNNGGYACPRGVGSGDFQAEDGTATFNSVNTITGETSQFTQNKRIYYYEGSILPIEWTNQHGCGGNSKVSCEIVLQYACEDTLDPRVDNFWPWVPGKASNTSTYYGRQHFRSGNNIAAPRDGVPRDSSDAATDTINDDEASAIPNTVETRRYGMQESYDYYQLCQRTERNRGLYTADQQVNRNDQRGTRQNPNGNRHGFECPEERDYYPWWHPSPWIDIAVLTDSANDTVCYPYSTTCTKRCDYYMNNTMNFNKKGYCDVSHSGSQDVSAKTNSRAWQNRRWYNNRGACEDAGFTWYEVSHSDNLNLANNSFVCAHTQYARANQLGNAFSETVISQSARTGVTASHVTENLNANRFLWTVPKIPTSKKGSSYFSSMTNAYKSCVLRIRYNTSTADFQQWPEDAVDPGTDRMVDYLNNSRTRNDMRSPLQQDPYIFIGPGDSASKGAQFVKLKVNTNQYGRTFQDRSYVFSIKPLPTSNSPPDLQADTPAIDANAIRAAIASGGKIYNVNVRGKRGNIVQTFPSVEYDFIPNALALNTNDMIHFQWTGSDYNPRRGCNDATGGPPDTNDYQTEANANQNSRADRSNVIFMYHMGNNVPKDYLGYNHNNPNLTWAQKNSMANSTLLQDVPCYNPGTDSQATAEACYDLLMRLAYLNQQSDSGSLVLRAGKPCLTQSQLDAIRNEDVADNHPLNCAKMNAKPYPYFDGGIMMMRKKGWFPYYSSRNNNFSNREQIGIICVGEDCKVDPSSGVLQDDNPQTNGMTAVTTVPSTCFDTADGSAGANANGAHSCLPTAVQMASGENVTFVLTTETFATQEQDNDNYGDGNPKGCAVLMYTADGSTTVEDNLALAFILLAVGLFVSWLAYYLYNRYQARRAGESKFRYDTAWQKAEPVEKKARPVSTNRPGSIQMSDNPGVKMGRPTASSTAAKMPSSGPKNYQKVKRMEMI